MKKSELRRIIKEEVTHQQYENKSSKLRNNIRKDKLNERNYNTNLGRIVRAISRELDVNGYLSPKAAQIDDVNDIIWNILQRTIK